MKLRKRNISILFIIAITICTSLGLYGCYDYATDKSGNYPSVPDNSLDKKDNSPYLYDYCEDGTIRFNGYREKIILAHLIPTNIENIPVTEIGQRAFEGELEKYGITSVTIPKTVKVIGASAFANNKLLTNVTFEENSELKTISSECFSGCESLENVTLPNSLMNIQSMAFYGCNSLTSITLPKNVFNCASNAFAECSSLQSVSVQSGNRTYTSLNGVLFENDEKLLVLYPFGKTDTAYVVPDSVLEVQAYAFMGNKHLRSVDLNNASYVRQFAFFDCENLNEIKGDALTFAEAGAFEDTAWFTAKIASSSEFVELGKVLFKYQGNSEEVVLKDYAYVMALAFAENVNIKKLTVEGNLWYGFDMSAFYNCKNLEVIKIKDASKMLRAGVGSFAGVSENLTVYVPKTFEEDYKESEDWADCKNILPIKTTVHFDSCGGMSIADGTVYYAYPLSPNPVSEKVGFQFNGWECKVGEDIFNIKTGEIWEHDLEECTFTAKWSERDYTILFYIENYKVEEMHYKISEGLIFPIPEREGYTFDGWYESEEFTGEAVTEIAAGEAGDRDYYAKWIPNKYVLTLNYNYDGCPVPATEEIECGSAFKLDAPEREGYIFDGWRYNGILLTNENGESVMNWNIADNAELYADWW
ncbi:leucine-rich repeat protein [Pumilibacter muris]|uniref:leucine-rich repeat protein n=1 Tax=Pumilibacter muris TaxID=2941510 RepID=UPI00203ECBB1|nr:leucine-rich repeat protein [Pumilibacter muris]